MAEQVALSSDVESRLSDDSDGRNQKFQLPSGKKRVVVFAVVVALMCGAAVFAPASSAPNSNLKGDIVKMYESCASSLQPRCAHLTGDCCPTAEGVFLDCCESATPPQTFIAAPKAEVPMPAEAPKAGDIVLHQIKSCELCKIRWCDQGMEVFPRNVASFSGYVMGAHLGASEYTCAQLPAQPRTVKIEGGLYLVEDQATYEYQGCFEDTWHRKLEFHKLTTGATPETCHAVCSDYAFFGLQGARHCFCGNGDELGARKSESECNMACHSEPSTMCGGLWRNSIYRVTQATSIVGGSFTLGVGETPAEVVKSADFKNAVETGIAKRTNERKENVDATIETARRLEPSSSARFLGSGDVFVHFTIRSQTPVAAVTSQIEQHTGELKTAIKSAAAAELLDVTIESINNVRAAAEKDCEKDDKCGQSAKPPAEAPNATNATNATDETNATNTTNL